MLRGGAEVALIALGVVLFVAGAVAPARRFVRRTSTLVVAVPLAAVAGIAVPGVCGRARVGAGAGASDEIQPALRDNPRAIWKP